MTETLWHSIKIESVIDELKTNKDTGLDNSEANDRLQKFGRNVVSGAKRKSHLVMFLSQFTDPLVVVLLVASAITFLLKDYIDTGVILAVVIINAIIGYIQEEKAESAIESLSKLLVTQSVVIRNGSTINIPAEELVPGDIVLLQSGDKVPADIRIIEEKNLYIDESILTGESAPVAKSKNQVQPDVPVSDRVCMAYSGTLVTNGTAKGVVVATGSSTEMGKISGLIEATPKIETPLTRKLAVFGKVLSAVVIGVAGLTFVIGIMLGHKPKEMFSAAVAIAVAMIPEGLPAIVTIVLAVGVKRMADRNAIIRTLPSVETLGSVTVICSDKTGTLTANEMTVRLIYAGGHNYELSGIGYDPRMDTIFSADADYELLKSEALVECLRCGLLCNESNLIYKDGEWIPSGDPTEVALITSAIKIYLDPETERRLRRRIDIIPFESANMYMATLNDLPDGGRVIYVKGSLEKLLDMCSSQMFDSEIRPLDKKHIQDRANDLAHQGYRILAFAKKNVPAEKNTISNDDLEDLVFLGIQAMSDPARPEAIEAVKECKEAGIKVKMITGDHVSTARSIARNLGIGGIDPVAISGAELSKLEGDEFTATACNTSVFARVAPEQKYKLVESLQEVGEIVAMTGDGVNDAPALKKADIGVAMGKAGSDVAKDASDMVLADDNFASIVAAVEEGRTVYSNLLKTLAFILPTNFGEGLIIIAALLVGYTLPVTPVQILWVNTVTAVTLALPLAFEPKEQGIMKIPPRNPNAPIISGWLITRIITVGVYMVIAGFFVFILEKGRGAALEEARTATVTTIVAIEVFYLFMARSENIPIWKLGLFSNPYIWIGVLIVALLQLGFVYLPIFNLFFGSSYLSAYLWLDIILASIPVMLIVRIERAITRRLSLKK